MSESSRATVSRCHRILLGAGAVLFLAVATRGAASVAMPRGSSAVVLTSFEQIWRVAETEPEARHPVRFDFLVYYYDPAWQALWGRSGAADSYLSFGRKAFSLTPGQRIHVEGTMVPSRGMVVDDPHVTVLSEASPLEAVSTRGDVGNASRFNKRLVTMEGYVDRQLARDATHVEIDLVTEGHAVLLHLLLKNDNIAPLVKGEFIRAKGVYFARTDPGNSRLELWVPGPDAIESQGTIDHDPRFALPITSIAQLGALKPDMPVRISGVVRAQVPGRSMTIGDESGEVTVATAQTQPVEVGAAVVAVGITGGAPADRTLLQVLYRPAGRLLTLVDEIYRVPVAEQKDVHRVRLEVLVYYFDAAWKVMWAHSGSSDHYISLAGEQLSAKPGQRVLIEGTVVPARGMIVDNPKLTVLADGVPIEVLEAGADVGNASRLNKHMVTVEGYVDRQVQNDARHTDLVLLVNDRLISGRLLTSNDVPQLEGTLIRAQGVYSATSDPAGGAPKLELWIQGEESIRVLGMLNQDPRFNIPATPIESVGAAPAGHAVRVAGTVRAQQPGTSLTIRDDTGQITVRAAQSMRLALGEPVEAVGWATTKGSDVLLTHGLYRRSRTPVSAAPGGLHHVRLAEQLRELSPEEAARKYPVQMTGVVTWAHPAATFFFVSDSSGGACIVQPPESPAAVIVGLKVEIAGTSANGDFCPVVQASDVRYTANVDLPDAPSVTLEQALTGVEEARWVTMSGFVREVAKESGWTRLGLTTSAGEFTALLPPDSNTDRLRGSVVRVRGVCSARTNARRQLTGIKIWVPSLEYVEIEEPEPPDPFGVAMQSIASLRQFASVQSSNRRVRVAGVVLSQSPGRFIHLQDGTEGLLVLSRAATHVAPGDRIQAVGFPGRENGRLVLREAVYRRIASGREPAALPVASVSPADGELDGRLVRIDARLREVVGLEHGTRLILQADPGIFGAVIDLPRETVPDDWVADSRLRLTGVYRIQFDEYKRPQAVELQLRTPADVQILATPSWWTARRILVVTGVLALATILGLGWVAALRRRVAQQTAQIREQLDNEKAARLDAALVRASKLESLGVLAGGIAHDFNNLLTVILCNLSLVRMGTRLGADEERCLRESERAASRARDLTQQLLTFARGGAPVRASIMLPELVRESAEFALHGSRARCEFDLAPDLWPANVDKGQIGQVVQNIVINANQAMSAGGIIHIALRNVAVVPGQVPALAAGRYLQLKIADSGAGISAEQLPRIFEPYFTTKPNGSGLGLATVYSIVKQHEGHVEVQSKVGQGTRFTVWLPAADQPPMITRPVAEQLPQRSGRVLFMDDEASIRQMAGTVLKRMGLDVTEVGDGAAVVREYCSARSAGQPYDLVILDLTVPGGMGGTEAMQKLRQVDPEVRAIVSSGYSSDPVMANHRAYGFSAVVSKPYEAAVLAHAVAALLAPAADRT